MISSIVNLAAVLGFALSMILESNFGGYFSSLLIAFSFVPMTGAYCFYAKKETKLAGITAIAFAAAYATIISLVYFAQITTVHSGNLSESAAAILDYQQSGLFFNYDMLGYAFMALATFFAGLTLKATLNTDKILKALLLIHGIFFFSCILFPMLGLFTADGEAWIGVAILEFWCAYFTPVGILSFLHFSKCED